MPGKFTCYVIGENALSIKCCEILLNRGHLVNAIASPNPAIRNWAIANNIEALELNGDLTSCLRSKPYDYLFSIVNLAILPDDVINSPRKCVINFHDGPLPKYAGINATSWAIVNQEKAYGITWHEITNDVDAGDILKQVVFEIENETALSLNVKCFAKGLSSFSDLVDELANGTNKPIMQNFNERTYFGKHKRPDQAAIIYWHRSAEEISALVRGLDFGRYANPLGLPKVKAGNEYFTIREIIVTDRKSIDSPGIIVSIGDEYIRVATRTNEIEFRKGFSIDGMPLSISKLVERYSLKSGNKLNELDIDSAKHISKLNSAIAKKEEYWVHQLSALEYANLHYAKKGISFELRSDFKTECVNPTANALSFFDKLDLSAQILLASAFGIFIGRHCGISDFTVGYTDTALLESIGEHGNLFSEYVPLRVSFDSGASVASAISRLSMTFKTTTNNNTYLRDVWGRYPALNRHIAAGGSSVSSVNIAHIEDVEAYEAQQGNIITFVVTSDPSSCSFFYDSSVIAEDDIKLLKAQFISFLEEVSANSEKEVAALSILSVDDRKKLLVEWNKTEVEFPTTKCIHQLFEEQVVKSAEAIAVAYERESLTYKKLNVSSNQLAHRLQKLGVGPDMLVGVYLHRSLDMMIAVMGTLKAGGAYVPLDPSFPKHRISYMIEDSECSVIVTEMRLEDKLDSVKADVVTIDTEWNDISNEESGNPCCNVTSANLAYVIYTSGSTGRPKGVMVEHRNVVNFFTGMDACVRYDAGSTWLAVTSLSFDISVLEIFWTLARGFKVVIYAGEEGSQSLAGGGSTHSIPELIRLHNVTHLQCTPSMASMLMLDEEAKSAFRNLKQLLIGGEAFPVTLAAQLREVINGDIVNMYGPTETTVWSTKYELNDEKQRIPIGQPIANTYIYILDDRLQPVPVGVPGELMIGGAGVTRGYLKRPELTAERFFRDSFVDEQEGRLYRTGDLARYLHDGNIEFLGRMDHQVKIRGYRIELGEIETVLSNHPKVRDSVVMAREDKPGQQRLVAYVIPRPGGSIRVDELRDYIKEKLPIYMVPTHIVTLRAFPHTPNKKIDRKALPPPKTVSTKQEVGLDSSWTEIEKAVADIWAETIGALPISRDDNFFDLGGDLLSAHTVTQSIQRTCQVDLPLETVFHAPTVAAFSEKLEQAFRKQADSGYAIKVMSSPREFELPKQEAAISQFERGFRPPESQIEKRIAKIWSNVLGVEKIGIHDNFFDLGGHSLTGVQIAFQIQKEFGLSVQLHTFFNAPSIAELSIMIASELGSKEVKVSELKKTAETLEKLKYTIKKRKVPISETKKDTPAAELTNNLSDEILSLTTEERHLLEQMLKKEGVDTSILPIAPRDDSQPIPLSFVQSRFWFLHQMDPEEPVYNIAVAFRIYGRLNADVLSDSINKIVERHEILRTIFPIMDGVPQQVVNDFVRLKLPVIGLTNSRDSVTKDELRNLINEEARRPFKLDDNSFLRIKLFNSGIDEHVLLIVSHHLVADGWSIRIFMQELGELYHTGVRGTEPSLPELPIQYADYSIWEQGSLAAKDMENHISYWKKKLKGTSMVLDLPTDSQRPAKETFAGATLPIQLSKELTKKLRMLSQKEGVTIYMTLLSAFQTLLYRYSRQEDLLVGTAVANINRSEIQTLIGSFSNNIVLRAQFHDNPSFFELLKQVRDAVLEAHEHQDLPFEKLLEEIQPERDLSRNPLFQVAFIFHQSTLEQHLQFDELSFESISVNLGSSRFDLTLEVDDDIEGLIGFLEYKQDLFQRETIEGMAEHLLQLLESVVEDPGRRVSELDILSNREKTYLLEELNCTAKTYPDELCIQQLFEEKAKQTPDRIAVEFEDMRLTYCELNKKANSLANYLLKLGATPEDLVGVCLDRSLEMIVGLLGILKAGCAYVPMDPLFPSERLNYMLDDAKISTLITQNHLTEIYSGFKGNVVRLDGDIDRIDLESSENPGIEVNSKNLAYVIYTSGSTGKPKGVQITHRAVVNFLISMQGEPGLTDKDRLVSVTTISFDISVLELFLPLITGAGTIIASRAVASDGKLLFKLLKGSKATIMQATPSTWRMLIEAGWEDTPQLTMLCGGEALPVDLAKQMLERGRELWNMYGPTETTIWSSVRKIEPGQDQVLIGPPIANTQFYILDNELNPVPAGVAGELLIGGDGLARGYLNRPELTGEKFIGSPFKSESSARLYRTGDLVRLRNSGDMEFLGRLDFQVKIRGFRIELGEIENILGEHPDIKEAVVVARDDGTDHKRLVGYVIPFDELELNVSELRMFLKDKLPEYMSPSLFVILKKFPLTPNAKIDRKALPEPEVSSSETGAENVAPRDELELQLRVIWQKVLGARSVGVNDNFFDLGGHSLLGAKLFAQIEKKLGKNLPLATLFQAQTIAEIAEILRQKDWQPTWSSLVPIRTGGTKPPLFLVHGAEGNVLLYKDLAHYLGEDQPAYGLQSLGLDGSKPMETSFESMAENYVREIRSVQPEGPYYLSGYCLGGTLALEMAQQLKQQGEEVALLVMFETYNLQEIPDSLPFYYRWCHKIQNVKYHLENILHSKAKGGMMFLKGKTSVEWSRFKVKLNIAFSKIANMLHLKGSLNYHHLLIDKVNDQAQADYIPRAYDGMVTLFKPRKHFAGLSDPYFGWGNLALKGVDIVTMPVSPRAVLNEPFVQMLAEKLGEEIERSLADRQDAMLE